MKSRGIEIFALDNFGIDYIKLPTTEFQTEIDKAYQGYTEAVEFLNSASIDKIELRGATESDEWHGEIFTSADKALIDRWIRLINKAEVSVFPASYYGSVGYSLRFYSGNKFVSLNSFVGSTFSTESEEALLNIDNYGTLQAELDALKAEMGYNPLN